MTTLETIDKIVIFLFIFVVTIIILLNRYYATEYYEGDIVPSATYNSAPINNLIYVDKDPLNTVNNDSNDYQKKFLNDVNRITYPNLDDVVEYGDYICTKKTSKKTAEINEEINQDLQKELSKNIPTNTGTIIRDINGHSCPNKSLNELHRTGEVPYKVTSNCGQLLSNIQGEDNGMDPADFYKNKYRAVSAVNLDDERFKGFNYGNFDENGSPYDIGRIPLNKTNDYPVGVNFSFQN